MTNSKRPVGRPKGSGLFPQQLHLYIDAQTLQMLKAQAKAAGQTISGYIRYLIHQGEEK